MSRIDSLPADQRAVLQLLVRRDRRYDELSELLGVDEAVVRERAHEALAALGPAETAEPAPERRREIGDHLLGQQTGDERDATERLLAGSPSARAWAQAVSGELRELAGERLPDMPGDVPGDDDAAGAALEAAGNASAAEAFGEPRPERPRSSRRLGALLLGLIALAAVAVALVFVLGGDDDGGETTTPAASTTQATQAQPQVEAQVNLAPPSSRRGSKAVGVVLVQRAQAQRQIVAAVQGLPRPKSGGYGIWLYTNASRKQWLGFFASQDQEGRLLARGELEAPVEQFREILVTREARGNPSSPGPVFLRGRIQLAGGAGG